MHCSENDTYCVSCVSLSNHGVPPNFSLSWVKMILLGLNIYWFLSVVTINSFKSLCVKSSLEGSVKAARKGCIATGIMLLHELTNTDEFQKFLGFCGETLTHLPKFRQFSAVLSLSLFNWSFVLVFLLQQFLY